MPYILPSLSDLIQYGHNTLKDKIEEEFGEVAGLNACHDRLKAKNTVAWACSLLVDSPSGRMLSH